MQNILDNASNFFTSAALNPDTAPELAAYDGGNRLALIRASVESNNLASKPFLLSTSTQSFSSTCANPANQSTTESADEIRDRKEGKESKKNRPHRAGTQQRRRKEKHLAPLQIKRCVDNTVPYLESAHVNSTSSAEDFKQGGEVASKMDPATALILRKSEWILNNDGVAVSTRTNRRKKKNKRIKNYSEVHEPASERRHLALNTTKKAVTFNESLSNGESFAGGKEKRCDASEFVSSPSRATLPTIEISPDRLDRDSEPEKGIVIDSSMSETMPREQKRSQSIWAGRTVTDHLENALPSTEWENEIARHIISVYATTKAGAERSPTASMLLKFAESGGPNAEEVTKTLFTPGSRRLETTEQLMRAEQEGNTRRSMIRSTPADSSSYRQDNWTIAGKGASNSERQPLYGAELGLAEDADAAPVEVPSQLRASFIIRTKNGGKLNVRGPPRCYPIWYAFVLSVFSISVINSVVR